ncbi:LytR/AlgR family response regulator transcription factor [Fulvivirga sedimenti]|uniref:LytTR family DNA-binding domain-containing protein n=1 Tax=Fulvivirga sedimenti TaxID=2879465 RepID=A0A9X1HLV3_9BACT|nr:LytTR family DNA-binding domain-containing protein [Fulvivirga sedimenti]MCA6074271.1 LytTR family DNA-binding domain-containing protein [Fulvivirga sedimenti]
MKVVILEDEKLAADHLRNLLVSLDAGIEICAVLDSVKSGIIWFLKNEEPDLVFMDIQLGDGLSFEILDAVTLQCPIIFTTAFDEYALRAFKVNSVDYILKPVEKDEIRNALKKMETLTRNSKPPQQERIKSAGQMLSSPFKERFIVKLGEHIHSLETNKILYFYSAHKATFAMYLDANKYLLDYSLDQIMEAVPPDKFFRINRKYIISFDAIEDIVQYSNSRLRIMLRHSSDMDVIVSRERVQEFKSWLDS